MSMQKKGKEFPYKALMDLYEPAAVPPSAYWEDLAGKAEGPLKTSFSVSYGRWITGLSGLAAAALLAVLLIPRSLGLPVTLASGSDAPRGFAESGLEFIAEGQTLELVTPGETVVLFPGAEMKVEPLGLGTAFHPRGNRYILRQGRMDLDHEGDRDTFEVSTPFGTIIPLGTALSAQVFPGEVRVECLRGKILFRSLTGEERILDAGQTLIWPEKKPEPGIQPATPVPADGGETRLPAPEAPVPVSDVPSQDLSPEKPLPGLREVWSLPLGGVVEEGTLTPEGWILRTAGEAVLAQPGTGRVSARWKPESILWTVHKGRLADYAGGKILLWTPEGRQVWEFASPPLSLGRLGSGPSGLLAASADGSLSVVDPYAGTLLRRFTLGAGSYGEPVEAEGKFLVSTLDRKLSALDAADGRILWSSNLSGRLAGDRPLVWENQVLVKDLSGRLYALEEGTGEVLWTLETGSTLQPGILPLPGRLLVRTARGTALVDSRGMDLGWTGGTVLAVLQPVPDLRVLAETGGIFLDQSGRRDVYREEELLGAFASGRYLAVQGKDFVVRMMVLEE